MLDIVYTAKLDICCINIQNLVLLLFQVNDSQHLAIHSCSYYFVYVFHDYILEYENYQN
jgi:hypothetical protein